VDADSRDARSAPGRTPSTTTYPRTTYATATAGRTAPRSSSGCWRSACGRASDGEALGARRGDAARILRLRSTPPGAAAWASATRASKHGSPDYSTKSLMPSLRPLGSPAV